MLEHIVEQWSPTIIKPRSSCKCRALEMWVLGQLKSIKSMEPEFKQYQMHLGQFIRKKGWTSKQWERIWLKEIHWTASLMVTYLIYKASISPFIAGPILLQLWHKRTCDIKGHAFGRYDSKKNLGHYLQKCMILCDLQIKNALSNLPSNLLLRSFGLLAHCTWQDFASSCDMMNVFHEKKHSYQMLG